MARRQRANNEGSVYFDAGKGLWRATISHRDATGKRKRISRHAKTKAQANRLLLELRQQQHEGTLVSPSAMTVAELLDRWKVVAEESVAVTTFDSYSRLIEVHLKPAIGQVKLTDLKAMHVEHALQVMKDKGRAGSTRCHAFVVMNLACAKAIKWGLIRLNPCRDAERPRVESKEFTALTADQVATFLLTIQGDRLEALYVMAIATGMRQGELLGLKWADIDFNSGTASIRRKVIELNGEFHVGNPKSAKGRRLIQLPGIAMEALQEHRKRMMIEGFAGNEFVFCDESGGFMKRRDLLRCHFHPLLASASLPRMRFHDLRHTAATLLLGENVHPKVVQEQLGHARIAVTLNTYSHVMPSLKEQAAGKMDQLLRSKSGSHAGATAATPHERQRTASDTETA